MNTKLSPYRVLLLSVLCLAMNACAENLAISSVAIAEPGSSVPRFAKLELLVTLTGGTYTRFYDPRPASNGLDLRATFTDPTGAAWHGFGYYDGGNWRIRFSPTIVGEWKYVVSAEDATGRVTTAAASFDCVPSGHPGFAKINGRYLQLTDGTTLVAVGPNNGWQMNLEQPTFSEMAAQNITMMSFWMNAPWVTPDQPEPRAPIENIAQGVGNYNQPACAYLDALCANAEAAGVYLVPTIWSHGNVRIPGQPWQDGWWNNNGYSAICSAADFYKTTANGVDTPQWAYQKNYYRYILARWGYSRAIVGWVTMCEIDGTTGYVFTQLQANVWCNRVSDYFAANDPLRTINGKHPNVVSKTDFSGDATTWNNGCDLIAVDTYTQQDSNVEIAAAVAVQQIGMRSTNKPGFHSEFGGRVPPASEPFHMHNGIWAGTATGACLAPMKWCDGGSWPMLTHPTSGPGLRNSLNYLAQFMAGIDYVGAPAYTAATVSVAPASSRGWGMRLADRGFAWVQDRFNNVGGETVNISTLTPGDYTVQWWNTWLPADQQTFMPYMVTVASNGVLSLTVPALAQRDIAVKFEFQGNRAPVPYELAARTADDTAGTLVLQAADKPAQVDKGNLFTALATDPEQLLSYPCEFGDGARGGSRPNSPEPKLTELADADADNISAGTGMVLSWFPPPCFENYDHPGFVAAGVAASLRPRQYAVPRRL